MLKKLFLHDLYATARISALLYLSGLACGVLTMLINLVTISLNTDILFLDLSVPLFYLFLCVAGLALSVAPPFVFLFYAYRSWFSDEGYLTFVLPATENEHLLSKFFVGTIWSVLAIPAAKLTSYIGNELPYVMVYPDYNEGYTPPAPEVGEQILDAVLPYLMVISLVMIALFAIVAGCSLMPKAKPVGVILFGAAGCITAGLGITTTDVIATSLENYSVYPDLIAEAVFFPVVAVVGYFLARLILRRSLNLE